jgi:putative tricarboxylic transport membrane protein
MMSLGAVFLYDALNIFEPAALSDMLGPRTFPIGLSASLTLLGAIVLVRVLAQGGLPADVGDKKVLFAVIAAVVVYGVAFRPLGYLTSTVLFLAFQFYYLGERRHWVTAIVSVGVTLALYMAFAQVLHVELPVGPLGF